MSERLQGHTALVTGASRGVGKGIALELARAGCRVAVNYHSDAAPAEQTVAEIEKLGVEAFAVRADVASSDGVIVNIGSGCNKLPFPHLVSYTASKGGIEMFTKVAAVELGRYGIRVSCVAPGAIEIERTRLEDPEYAATWGKITPLGRVGTPADVGGAVVFLASQEASFISGQTIWVDGALF